MRKTKPHWLLSGRGLRQNLEGGRVKSGSRQAMYGSRNESRAETSAKEKPQYLWLQCRHSAGRRVMEQLLGRRIAARITALFAAVFIVFVSYGYGNNAIMADVLAYPAQTEQAEEENTEDAPDIGAMILSMKEILPEGTPFTDKDNKWANPVWPYRGSGCVAFAMFISDNVYGASTPVHHLIDVSPDNIMVGDIIRIEDKHTVLVYAVDDTSVTVCEGNYRKTVHWGRVITKASLEGKITYIARRVPAAQN